MTLQLGASLIDHSRCIIYGYNVSLIHATGDDAVKKSSPLTFQKNNVVCLAQDYFRLDVLGVSSEPAPVEDFVVPQRWFKGVFLSLSSNIRIV